MKHYWVVSPEMEFRGSGWYDPPEIGHCVVLVEAQNKRDARRKAIKEKEMKEWVHECKSDKACPLAHLKVEEAVCPHGICECGTFCHNVCNVCEEEREREFREI